MTRRQQLTPSYLDNVSIPSRPLIYKARKYSFRKPADILCTINELIYHQKNLGQRSTTNLSPWFKDSACACSNQPREHGFLAIRPNRHSNSPNIRCKLEQQHPGNKDQQMHFGERKPFAPTSKDVSFS